MDQARIVNNGLLGKFPYNIISNIFLYLDQRDYLNCMGTCRGWYDSVRKATTDQSDTVRIGFWEDFLMKLLPRSFRTSINKTV